MRKPIARHFILLVLAFSSFLLHAQDLVNSRKGSYYTFIYTINNDQAGILYRENSKFNDTFLTQLYDSYPTDSLYKKELPVGHYLFVHTLGNSLLGELYSVNNLQMNVLNNHRDLILAFYDLSGQEQHNIDVKIRSKKIMLDSKTKTYRLSKSNRNGVVLATKDHHVSYFEIDKRYNASILMRSAKSIARAVPFRYIISPFIYTVRNTKSLIQNNHINPPSIYYSMRSLFNGRKYSGYMVLNKPIFKPGDTIRLKAYLTSKRGKPLLRKASIFITNGYPYYSKKIASITSKQKGHFIYEIKLSDSLNLDLDNYYSIVLKKPNGHDILGSSFRFEEYELKQNVYAMRSEDKPDERKALLFLKGTDSNEMPLYDARFEVLLMPQDITHFYGEHVFVPDTLWFHSGKLDPLGETRVTLPDSVMPSVDVKYKAEISFLNSANERIQKVAFLNHKHNPFPARLEIKNDSLYVEATDSSFTNELLLKRENADSRISRSKIKLPYHEKLIYIINSYTIGQGSDSVTLDVNPLPSDVNIMTSRSKDSLTIISQNPRKIMFRYFLFKNQKLLEKGQAETIKIFRPANISDNYSISIQYVWAGSSQTRDYQIGFDQKELNIALDHNDVIYPGQKVTLTINVTDAFGKPVENADLTAYAITKKFNNTFPPRVPAYVKAKKDRKSVNEFTQSTLLHKSITEQLNYIEWQKKLGLDSITFYHFLYPDTGYFEVRTPAEVSQFAPFVVSHGSLQNIRIIYLDNEPIYYHGASTIEPYSFNAKPGNHRLEIRLSKSTIYIQYFQIKVAQKLIFSVDMDHLTAGITMQKMPLDIDKKEVKKLESHFILVESNSGNAYLRQGDQFHLLERNSNHYENQWLTGPFISGPATYTHREGTSFSFQYEPFYRYQFYGNVLKLHQADIGKSIRNSFHNYQYQQYSFNDKVLTLSSITDSWRNQIGKEVFNFRRYPYYKENENSGKLYLVREGSKSQPDSLEVIATFAINAEHPDEYHILPGIAHDQDFDKGLYQIVLILRNRQYIREDSILIKAHGINYYNLSTSPIHPNDVFSSRLFNEVRKWSSSNVRKFDDREAELQRLRTSYYQTPSTYTFIHTVKGRITDNLGESISGANIIVKGIAHGTVTDGDGYFTLQCPADATLVISFIGYITHEEQVDNRTTINSILKPDIMQLSEVVVTGYGVEQKMDMVGSVSVVRTADLLYTPSGNLNSLLQGRSPGVAASGTPGGSGSVRIRGYGSVTEAEPLVVIDGVPSRLSDVNQSMITSMEVLKDAQASMIYGARAANGVILISTKGRMNRNELLQMGRTALQIPAMEEIPGNALRKNFRDYAFWQPALHTNEQGKATFETVFPDDVTGWNAYVLGMASKKRTGSTNSVIKSYKPLIAQIAQPNFLIEGDEAKAIGKITNYNQGKITLERTIKVNNVEINTSSVEVENSKVDTIPLITKGLDSLQVYYSASYQSYSDGELRKLPVYPRGTSEYSGVFVAMPRDTSFTLTFPEAGTLKIFAQADLYDVLLEEIGYLKAYQYECNEQLASKLRAFLMEKQLLDYKKEKFTHNREIEKIIRRLMSSQNSDGSWGWWENNSGESWISLHVVHSLMYASKQGYAVTYNLDNLIRFLETQLANVSTPVRMEIFQFLLEQKRSVNVKELIDTLRKSNKATVYNKLMAERLAQLNGEKPNLEWIKSIRSQTIKGNYYWGDGKILPYDNDVLNTLIAYKIQEREDPKSKALVQIMNYFFEKRKKHWGNTYESSLITEALIPQFMASTSTEKPTLTLTGASTKKADNFPFEYQMNEKIITVSKSGSSPIYFSAFQEHWNTTPDFVNKDFKVTTSFPSGTWTAGKPIKLTITLEVIHDAEYVMIEVPIPAGCSYQNKSQSNTNREVHREFNVSKTNIFCKYLTKGIYTYTIDLLPRYSGHYTLNPARAECMYFPTLFGREQIKSIVIK